MLLLEYGNLEGKAASGTPISIRAAPPANSPLFDPGAITFLRSPLVPGFWPSMGFVLTTFMAISLCVAIPSIEGAQ